jgi:hypothetical protein
MRPTIPTNTPIDFIKIDVEGAELSVLRGGCQVIKKYKPFIIFEHSARRAKFYGTTSKQIYDLLTEELGLEVCLMEQWLKGHTGLRWEEFSKEVERLEYYFIAYSR